MLDVQYSHRHVSELSEELVLDMLSRKTAVLYDFAARTGARIGLEQVGDSQDSKNLVNALGTFAADCGIAFQLRDDVLGITADEKRLGKPVGSDLREGKKTLIVFHALKQASEEQTDILMGVLGNPLAGTNEIADAMQVLEDLGSLDYVRALADRYVQSALSQLAQLPDTPYRKLLYLWARYLVARDF